MASTANVVINDGTTAQTFAPVKRDGFRLLFLNKVGVIAAAFKALTLGFDMRSSRRKTDKVFLDLDYPLERTDSFGVVSAVNVIRWRLVGTIPEVATAAESLAAYNLVKNGVAHAAFAAYVTGDPML